MKYIITFFTVALFSFLGQAQKEVVKWETELIKLDDKQYKIVLTAHIEENWFLYSQYLDEGGPIPTTIEVEEQSHYSVDGKTEEMQENSVEMMDEMFGMKLKKYKKKATFVQKISSEKDLSEIKGSIEFMTCDDSRCLPPKVIYFTASVRQ